MALSTLTRSTPTALRTLHRVLSTKSTNTQQAHIIYSNPRRGRAAAMSVLAIAQAGFWTSATILAQQVPEPILGPAWSVGGFGLSAAFGLLINTYLKRSVSEIALLNGPAIRVTAHAFGGVAARPVTMRAADVKAGAQKDDDNERYWTFANRSEGASTLYYVVDMNSGVVDRDAVRAIVKGGEHLMVFSHKRDAGQMRQRWEQWKEASADHR